MTKKPTGLAAAVSKKASVVVPEPQPAADGKTRTLTLRLPPLVHEQLREMSFTSRRSQHALLMEGLDRFFPDGVEVAQFLYLLLHNEKIRDVIDVVSGDLRFVRQGDHQG